MVNDRLHSHYTATTATTAKKGQRHFSKEPVETSACKHLTKDFACFVWRSSWQWPQKEWQTPWCTSAFSNSSPRQNSESPVGFSTAWFHCLSISAAVVLMSIKSSFKHPVADARPPFHVCHRSAFWYCKYVWWSREPEIFLRTVAFSWDAASNAASPNLTLWLVVSSFAFNGCSLASCRKHSSWFASASKLARACGSRDFHSSASSLTLTFHSSLASCKPESFCLWKMFQPDEGWTQKISPCQMCTPFAYAEIEIF